MMTSGLAINPNLFSSSDDPSIGWDVHYNNTACSGYSCEEALTLVLREFFFHPTEWTEDLYTDYAKGYFVVAPMDLIGWNNE